MNNQIDQDEIIIEIEGVCEWVNLPLVKRYDEYGSKQCADKLKQTSDYLKEQANGREIHLHLLTGNIDTVIVNNDPAHVL